MRLGRWRSAALVLAAVAGVLVGRLWPEASSPVGPGVDAQVAEALPVTTVTGRALAPPVAVAVGDVQPASATALATAAAPSNTVAATFHPRPQTEWQGMKVNLSLRATCESSEGCGLAMACREDGLCGPCETDGHCAGGEVCVLDHCVRRELADCRTRADCAGQTAPGEDAALCMLSGYSPGDGRNNRDLRASCVSPEGGELEG